MEPIGKYAILSAAFFVLFYLAALGLSLLLVPFSQAVFDTQLAIDGQPAWGNDARYVVFNQSYFSADRNRLIVLGASTARDAFRPELIQPMPNGCAVANLALSGSNISEIGDGVQVLYDALPAGRHGRLTFVVGSYYMLFASDRQLWHGTNNPMVAEMLRYGQYARARDGRLAPAVRGGAALGFAMLLRPVALTPALPKLVFNAILNNSLGLQMKAFLHGLMYKKGFSDWQNYLDQQSDLNAVSISPYWRAELLKQRLEAAGGDHELPREQFDRLRQLIDLVTRNGDAIMIADLPIPTWHAAGVPKLETSYDRQISDIVRRYHGVRGFGYLDMRSINDPDDFFDSAHVKPRLWPAWSGRLATYLQERSGANSLQGGGCGP
jgi:hypothetical protein